MKTTKVRIVDIGRGPQIEGHRITVMDVFYYLHRGRDFDFIHQVMPSLTREEFDVVVEYVNEHRDELAQEDRWVEERIQAEIAEQEAKGLRRKADEPISLDVRVARMKETLRERQQHHSEKNGDHVAH